MRNSVDLRLAALGLRRRTTTADGNCLFHAVSFLLHKNGIANVSATDLRARVCGFIRENLDLFREDIEREYESVDKFLSLMRKQGTYGCCIVLSAFSILFNVNFHIHFPTSVFQSNPGSERLNLHIIFLRGTRGLNGHWEATERL